MTDEQHPNASEEPTPDESFTWTTDGASNGEHAHGGNGSTSGPAESAGGSAATTATAILESIRDAIDDLAERASPTVREFSARAAEFAAVAADKTAPYVKRAGDVTADASGKLASKSRTWAADIRASLATHDVDAPDAAGRPPARPARTRPRRHRRRPRRRRSVRRRDPGLSPKPILRS